MQTACCALQIECSIGKEMTILQLHSLCPRGKLLYLQIVQRQA